MMNIIDAPFLCYKTYHGMRGVELSEEDRRTEIIFGFLKQLLVIAKRFPAEDWVFAWDSRRSFRKNMYPQYKEGRREKATKEEKELMRVAHSQFGELRRVVLPNMGFTNNFIFTGLEADDIIAQVCNQYSHYQDILIVSSDGDLYQLISPCVSFYNPTQKKMLDFTGFTKKYGILPAQWANVKMLAGCSTDNVEGIDGVGEQTAIKYINSTLKHTYKSYKAIEGGGEIIRRNKKLVKLPFEGTPVVSIETDRLKSFSFMKVFKKYKFKSFLFRKNFTEWEVAFGLK